MEPRHSDGDRHFVPVDSHLTLAFHQGFQAFSLLAADQRPFGSRLFCRTVFAKLTQEPAETTAVKRHTLCAAVSLHS